MGEIDDTAHRDDTSEVEKPEERRRSFDRAIPEMLDYLTLPGLSRELAVKLARIRPSNIAQAASIEGMTPAALVLLLSAVRKSAPERRVG